jgi:cytochrome c-type biogenesis protein CcsB
VSSESWAQLSNQFIYAAMAVYTLAMIAFAYDLAFAGLRGKRTDSVDSDATASLANGDTADSSADALVSVGAEGGAVATVAASTVAPDASSRADATSVRARRSRREAGRSDELPTSDSAARTKFGNIGFSLTVLAFGLHAVAVVTRGVAADRVPWGNMYEFAITATLSVIGIYLLLSTKYDLRWLGVFVVTPVLLTLGLAVTVLYTEAGQLVPALRSYWLVIHVSAAVIAFGLFTMAALVSVLYLVKARYERRGATSRTGFLDRIPSAAALDKLAYRVVAFVFPLWTFAVIAGAIWAENAWGRYWGWDPKETWAFITWVIYAGYLHARATAGWKGRKAAIIALVGYGSLIFNFIGVNIWLPGLHSYSGL